MQRPRPQNQQFEYFTADQPLQLEHFTVLYGFPRFLAALSESLPPGQALPNLADLIQDRCEKLLEQICMPISA